MISDAGDNFVKQNWLIMNPPFKESTDPGLIKKNKPEK